MNSHDQFSFKISIKLFSELAYVCIDCIGGDIGKIWPNMLEESDSRDDLTWMEHEILEEYELFCAEEEGFPTPADRSREEIEFEIFDS